MSRRQVCTTAALAATILTTGCGSSTRSQTAPLQSPAQVGLPVGVTNGLRPGVPAVYARFSCPYINVVNISCSTAKAIVRAYYASPARALSVADADHGSVPFQCVWAAGNVSCLDLDSSSAVSFQGPRPR
jgi:hypothetical protein